MVCSTSVRQKYRLGSRISYINSFQTRSKKFSWFGCCFFAICCQMPHMIISWVPCMCVFGISCVVSWYSRIILRYTSETMINSSLHRLAVSRVIILIQVLLHGTYLIRTCNFAQFMSGLIQAGPKKKELLRSIHERVVEEDLYCSLLSSLRRNRRQECHCHRYSISP